jgi:hypothetical protein
MIWYDVRQSRSRIRWYDIGCRCGRGMSYQRRRRERQRSKRQNGPCGPPWAAAAAAYRRECPRPGRLPAASTRSARDGSCTSSRRPRPETSRGRRAWRMMGAEASGGTTGGGGADHADLLPPDSAGRLARDDALPAADPLLGLLAFGNDELLRSEPVEAHHVRNLDSGAEDAPLGVCAILVDLPQTRSSVSCRHREDSRRETHDVDAAEDDHLEVLERMVRQEVALPQRASRRRIPDGRQSGA